MTSERADASQCAVGATTSVCRACSDRSVALFDGEVLGRIAVTYHRCVACMTLQLPAPHWLDEA